MVASKAPGIFAFDMDAKAEEKPDFPVLTFENSPYPDEVLTYSELVRKGRRLARALEKSGFGPGDTLSLIMRNHPENPIAMYAASLVRAIMVPIDPRSRGDKLRFQIKNSDSKGVIFSAEFLEEMKIALSELPEVKVIGVRYKDDFTGAIDTKYPDIEDIMSGPDVPPSEPVEHNINDKLMMIYSSGTTGDPKGVHVRNSRLGAFTMIGRHIWKYRPDDKLYNGLSLSHANAYVCTMFPALALSIPAVISRRFTKSRFWDIIRAHGCTCFTNLGGVMMGLYSEPPRPDDADNPARLCVSAGTPRAIWEAFEQRFKVKIHEWYATVEGGFAHNPPDVGPVGSFGKPLEGLFEMKVVREDDTECDPYEVGELISRNVQGETKVEYHGQAEASSAKTRGGWLRTGDMCHRDEAGWLFFDFRQGAGLRRQGDFIMPEYVEKVVAEHPDVTDVCVYGIPAMSGAPGESDVVAAIVPTGPNPPDIKSIFQTCVAGLERNSVPTFIQVVPEIPKTPSEKNLDRLLRQEFGPDKPNVCKFKDYQ